MCVALVPFYSSTVLRYEAFTVDLANANLSGIENISM